MQELMAASDIVVNERVDSEVRTAGVTDIVIQRTVDLTVTPATSVDSVQPAQPLSTVEPVASTAPVTDVDDADDFDEDDDEDTLDETTGRPVDLVLIESDGLPPELAWQERALCAQTDPEAFFPEKGGSTREAKRVCMSCEVRAECLDYALAKDERFGIWVVCPSASGDGSRSRRSDRSTSYPSVSLRSIRIRAPETGRRPTCPRPIPWCSDSIPAPIRSSRRSSTWPRPNGCRPATGPA